MENTAAFGACFSQVSIIAMADLVGPPAMSSCELRQARKGATVAVRTCAGVLAGRGRLQYCVPLAFFSIFLAVISMFYRVVHPRINSVSI